MNKILLLFATLMPSLEALSLTNALQEADSIEELLVCVNEPTRINLRHLYGSDLDNQLKEVLNKLATDMRASRICAPFIIKLLQAGAKIHDRVNLIYLIAIGDQTIHEILEERAALYKERFQKELGWRSILLKIPIVRLNKKLADQWYILKALNSSDPYKYLVIFHHYGEF